MVHEMFKNMKSGDTIHYDRTDAHYERGNYIYIATFPTKGTDDNFRNFCLLKKVDTGEEFVCPERHVMYDFNFGEL